MQTGFEEAGIAFQLLSKVFRFKILRKLQCTAKSIPVAILKATKHVLPAPLEIIFNASFSTGIVLDLFKIAKVTPVFKKGCANKFK